MLEDDLLNYYAEKYKVDYQTNIPFPHIVIDSFVGEPTLCEIIKEYENFNNFQRFNNKLEDKYFCDQSDMFPPRTKELFERLNSQSFTHFLEKLTGIKGIIANKQASGGGMHMIKRGGKLGVHIDFNKKYNLERRINVLLFMNMEWKAEYGGHLELWSLDKEGKLDTCKKISPEFNRIVIFNTSEISYHGHPHPLNCPEHMSRKSMAAYFFTEAQDSSCAHGTMFVDA